MSDPIRDAIKRAIISTGIDLLNADPLNKEADTENDAENEAPAEQGGDGPFDFYEATRVLPPGRTDDDMIDAIAKDAGLSRDEAEKAYRLSLRGRIAKSSMYQVVVCELEPDGDGETIVHLSIKRLDREPIHDWRALQQIKNAIVGDESEAMEIYPAESRLVDGANQYHLWCFRPGFRIPVGFDTRLVSNDDGFCGSKQRPFESRDALLPSRAQLCDSLHDLLRCVDRGGNVPSEVRSQASALVDQIEHARRVFPAELSVTNRLKSALALVKSAQDLIDPIACAETFPHEDAEIRALTRRLALMADEQLQETRDDLTQLINALAELPTEKQS
jgi:hypothetical protein